MPVKPGRLAVMSSSQRCRRPVTMTRLPWSWNASASARPMPLVPPVIRMVLPVVFMIRDSWDARGIRQGGGLATSPGAVRGSGSRERVPRQAAPAWQKPRWGEAKKVGEVTSCQRAFVPSRHSQLGSSRQRTRWMTVTPTAAHCALRSEFSAAGLPSSIRLPHRYRRMRSGFEATPDARRRCPTQWAARRAPPTAAYSTAAPAAMRRWRRRRCR
ncbi:hypothetical protein G6F32_013688 [Rhizopus arrhizus]|nr:hypothetical protein G6F32_013688 [Rhizopus arrhizus]